MAQLQSTTVDDTGAIQLPSGTTAQRPGSPNGGDYRFNTTTRHIEVYDSVQGTWVSEFGKNPNLPCPKNGSELVAAHPNLPSGMYYLNPNGNGPGKFYVDMDYDGGGWVLVMVNRAGNGGLHSSGATYATIPYNRTIRSINHQTNSDSNRKHDPGQNCNMIVGPDMWEGLGHTVVQYVASSNVKLSETGSHTKRYRWSYTSLGSSYAFSGAASVSDETGTGVPGFYNYHARNGYNFTTSDNDQDAYGANCANLYGGHPWWFGACWSGNYWGSTSGNYQDAPFWNGSGSDYHNFGAVYLKEL